MATGFGLRAAVCGEADPKEGGGDGATTSADGGTTVTDGGTTDGGTTDGGTSAADGGTTTVDCTTLSLDDCLSYDHCGYSAAWPILPTDDGWCTDADAGWTPLACVPRKQDCGAVEVYTTTKDRPDECLWTFPSTCVPPGFIECPDDSGYLWPCP